MAESNIEVELLKTQEAAEEGYELANKKYLEIVLTLKKAAATIKEANSGNSKIPHLQSTMLFDRQNNEIEELQKSIAGIRKNIAALKEQQKDFSIAVFGGEMVGKSTLKEILTHGDGSSIGKGAEHDTKDFRTYYWNGLKITDLPGFKFFKSEENNKFGMEVAKSADLVLFLITTEKPTQEEIQCLAQLRSLGKTILGIVNVKKTLRSKKRESIIAELQKLLSHNEEILNVVQSLKSAAKDYHQNWNDIKFFPTHLSSAFDALQSKDDELYEASRFTEIRDFIIEKVRTDGKFLRIKNFVDAIAVPMNDILNKLFEHSATSLKESRIWLNKSKDIKLWRRNFWDRLQKELYEIFTQLSQEIDSAILGFVEKNYDSKDFNQKWSEQFTSFDAVKRYQKILQSFSVECENELKKFSIELTDDLKNFLGGKTQTDIDTDDTTQWEKYTSIAVPKISADVSNVEWTSKPDTDSILAFLKKLFQNKEEAIKEDKERLRTQLVESGSNELNKINKQARAVFNKQIMGKIDEFSDDLIAYSHMLARLGQSQSKIAEQFIDQYAELNAVLLTEAVKYKGAGEIDEVKATLRVPGIMSVVIAEESDVNNRAVSALLGERFFVMRPSKDWNATMRKVLGCPFELETYPLEVETDAKTYSVKPTSKVSNKRLKLTQQISPYPVITN